MRVPYIVERSSGCFQHIGFRRNREIKLALLPSIWFAYLTQVHTPPAARCLLASADCVQRFVSDITKQKRAIECFRRR